MSARALGRDAPRTCVGVGPRLGWSLVSMIVITAGCTLSFDAPSDAARDARAGRSDAALDGMVQAVDSAGIDGLAPPPPPPGPDTGVPPADAGDSGAGCDPARCPHGTCGVAYCAGTSCAEMPAGSGVACDDGDPCTTGDVCDSMGRCVAGAPCADDANACTAEACGAMGCTSSPVPDDSACTLATGAAGRCCAGGCVATSVDPAHCGTCRTTCSASTSCIDGACRSCTTDADCAVASLDCVRRASCEVGRCRITVESGACYIDGRCWRTGDHNPANLCDVCTTRSTSWTTRSTCEDGLFCTVSDPCSDGVCSSGEPRDCDDGNPCTADSCNETFDRCDNTPIAEGTSCDDGDACTTGDHCAPDGSCGSTDTVTCSGPAPVCHVYACDSSTGSCANLPDIGASCDDGDCCTTTDSCVRQVSGETLCQGTATLPENPCVSPACQLVGGAPLCQQLPLPGGTSCVDPTCAGTPVCDGAGTCICI